MALTFAQKSDVRRHLDYPTAGLLRNSPAGGSLASPFVGYRFFQTYGRLEYKMNNLNADEEARLLGVAYGAVVLIGPSPNIGDTVSIVLQGGAISSPQTITATAQPGDGLVQLSQRLAANAAQNTTLQAASILAISPFGSGPFSENAVPLAEVAFEAPLPFQFTSASGTGLVVPQVTASGTFLNPTASLDGSTTLWGYLPILNGLEAAWAGSSQLAYVNKAGPFVARNNEMGQRLSLYKNWQTRLSHYLEIPIYTGGPTAIRPGYANTSRFM